MSRVPARRRGKGMIKGRELKPRAADWLTDRPTDPPTLSADWPTDLPPRLTDWPTDPPSRLTDRPTYLPPRLTDWPSDFLGCLERRWTQGWWNLFSRPLSVIPTPHPFRHKPLTEPRTRSGSSRPPGSSLRRSLEREGVRRTPLARREGSPHSPKWWVWFPITRLVCKGYILHWGSSVAIPAARDPAARCPTSQLRAASARRKTFN